MLAVCAPLPVSQTLTSVAESSAAMYCPFGEKATWVAEATSQTVVGCISDPANGTGNSHMASLLLGL